MKWPFWNRCNLSKKRTIKYFNYCLEESFVKAGILVYFKEIFFFFFYFKEIWSGLGGIIFFNVQNIKITTFFKKITKILWKYLPKKQELLLGSPKLHQPATSWSIVVLKAENNKIISKGYLNLTYSFSTRRSFWYILKQLGVTLRFLLRSPKLHWNVLFSVPKTVF